jgi:Heavy metal binding domain
MDRRAVYVLSLCALSVVTSSDRVALAESVARSAALPAVRGAPAQAPDPARDLVYICPMDPDVRSHTQGTCRRCGMTLVAGVPDPEEFHLDARVFPAPPQPSKTTVLQFLVHDPWRDRPVAAYNVLHERLFHAFVVSEDLEFFEHGHPALVADGMFQYPITFPRPGLFRVLSDFYPVGATPQLTTTTVLVPGGDQEPAQLVRDYSPKSGENMRVSLMTIPDNPVAGNRTQLRLTLEDGGSIEQYLGAWGHMLAASADLIDMMHEHPFWADGGPQLEFHVVFPRPQSYRVWVQLQRQGVINTVHFDVPVSRLD